MTGRRVNVLVLSSEHPLSGYGSATALRMFIAAAATQPSWTVTTIASCRRRALPPRGAVRTRRLAALAAFTARALVAAVLLRSDEVDIVVSWQPLPAALAGWIAARRTGAMHLVRTCGPELHPSWSAFPALTAAARPLTHRLLAHADGVVVKSMLERDLLPAKVSADRVHLVPNAVVGGRTISRPVGDVVRVLAVAQLEKHKGGEQLIAAFIATTARRRHRARLTIVGGGSQRGRLKRLADPAATAVRFTGQLPSSAMPSVYAAHDVLVVASEWEGSSNAVLEALAAGLPVIGCTAAVGDAVDHGVNGLVLPSASTPALTAAIDLFVGLPGDRVLLMREAARRVAERHRPADLVTAYSRLFGSLR